MTSTWQLTTIQKSVQRKFRKLILWLKEHCVSDKSKLQHRPLAYPGRSIPLSSRWGGHVIIRVFMVVRNFDPHSQGDGIFELNPPDCLFWVLLHATRFHCSLFSATNSKAIYRVARKLYNFLKQSEYC